MYLVCDMSSVIRKFSLDDPHDSQASEHINVEEMNKPRDIVACRRDRQLYVAELHCIWRVSADDRPDVPEKWLPTESSKDTFHIRTLSVTSGRLLVMSLDPPRLLQYSTISKQLLQEVKMPDYMKDLYHGVETTRDTFVVCHRGMRKDGQRWAVSEQFSCVISFYIPYRVLPLLTIWDDYFVLEFAVNCNCKLDTTHYIRRRESCGIQSIRDASSSADTHSVTA